MSRLKLKVFLGALAVLAAATIIIIALQRKPGKIMELTVSGGFWTRHEKYEYYSNGSIIFNDLARNKSGSSLIPISTNDELLRRMKTLLEAYPGGLKLEPGSGADYFIYNLTIYSNGRTVTYYWTDVSGELPRELSYLASLLHELNSFASGYSKIVFYLKTDRLIANKGETLKILAIAFNPSQEDFPYASPTPCSPDFKIHLQAPGGERIELYPVGHDPEKPCIQVIQNRVLKAGGTIEAEYAYTFNKEGTYVLEAFFPYAEWSETRYTYMLMVLVQ
ncbi:MAG: hypothetical protein N3F08_00635 [Crenarchaeota archaeon]|nr:hypothetical protein [Thermoproteota archaeon]